MTSKLMSVFLVVALLVGLAVARPDVDVCEAELEKSLVKEMVGPQEINSLCVLADRGYLGTNVADCLTKLTSHPAAALGRRLRHGEAAYVCDAIRDVVVSYLTSHSSQGI